MLSNINRDYLCILDVKTGAINAPKMYFYNTDRSTSNIYVQLVVKETIVSATPIENATDFVIEAKIVKPNGFVKEMTGQLVNEADAIYEFDLPEDFTDLTGINQVEFWVRARVTDREERITSASTKYTVKGSILNSIDDNIKDDNDYPIFLALMERVERLDKEVTEVSLATKALNEEAKGELAKIKADEVEIANNEVIRQAQEAARVTNEEARKTEELRRKDNETARGEAEVVRQEQEELREGNEITRQSNEASREATEQTRQANENARIANENARIANENARKQAETARVGAEATRVTAEDERIAKENLRIEVEEQRKANEIDRQQGYEVMGQEIDTMKVIVENQNDKIRRITDSDTRQDILINGLYNSDHGRLTATQEGNIVSLPEAKYGIATVDEIVGNTMVNCNKEAGKSIVLTEAINVEGTNDITLTQGVDGAQADVYVEGNTMVNVCDQEEAVAITKSYTVETGNHISLQGEYDGKCRPVVHGNTLWIDNDTEEVLTAFDDTKNLRLQSSFEDKVVTQEMVDSGNELAENLGKYKVEYKVTGKNKFDGKLIAGVNISYLDGIEFTGDYYTDYYATDFIRVFPNITYTVSFDNDNDYRFALYDKNKQFIFGTTAKTFTPDNNGYYVRIANKYCGLKQIEEGSTATPYEPYKEHIKTYYLNSPLLEGDTIEESGNDVVHVHRYKKIKLSIVSSPWNITNEDNEYIIFRNMLDETIMRDGNAITDTLPFRTGNGEKTNISLNEFYIKILKSKLSTQDVNGLKQYLQQNPVTVVYQLASPTYEVISQNDSILQDSYVGGSLDVDTAVPIEKVEFKKTILENKYLYANTAYTVQFEADNVGIANITLGGTTLASASVVKGTNKISITTPNTLADNNLVLDGIGFNASNIVVTEATNGDFGYFKGMKSVGEQEGNNIEILSRNKNFLISGFESGNINDNGNLFNQISYLRSVDYEYCIPNTEIIASYNGLFRLSQFFFFDKDKTFLSRSTTTTAIVPKNAKYFKLVIVKKDGTEVTHGDINNYANKTTMVRLTGQTDVYVEPKYNKKQILLNEPLRKVRDIADRYVLVDGKWYIERNIRQKLLTGADSEEWVVHNYVDENVTEFRYNTGNPVIVGNPNSTISDKLIGKAEGKIDRIAWAGDVVYITISINKLPTNDVAGLRQWLSNNNILVQNQLASPVYEPINYNPLDIYSDTTHISINSNIPAKLKARNHGYNCMLKPNTTYTATYNIDGTPQKTTIVTPATLDDATRFTGTGTLKNFLLLEGDISNPPAFFSGMRSSFDQEYDEVKGKWKVNIRVVGKNLFDKNIVFQPGLTIHNQNGDVLSGKDCVTDLIENVIFKRGNTYSISCDEISYHKIVFYDENNKFITRYEFTSNGNFTVPNNTKYYRLSYYPTSNLNISTLQIEQGDTASEYEPYTYNDITIYINEPLRKGDIIRDENRKILVERHSKEVVLDGSDDEGWKLYNDDWQNDEIISFATYFENSKSWSWGDFPTSSILIDKIPVYTNNYCHDNNILGFTSDNNRYKDNKVIRVPKLYLTTKDLAGFKAWLSENPVTVVYELASPVIEEVETDYTRLMLECYENATVYFNSHIFPTSTIRYTANVISTAEIMSVNDEQDSMIIDNATQIAMITLTM